MGSGDAAGQIQRRRKRRFAKVAKLKDAPCTDCGGRFPSVCMDFDHLVKGTPVSRALNNGWGWDRILQEIAKCELVCSNCHRIRTSERNQHGRKPTKKPLRGGRPKST